QRGILPWKANPAPSVGTKGAGIGCVTTGLTPLGASAPGALRGEVGSQPLVRGKVLNHAALTDIGHRGPDLALDSLYLTPGPSAREFFRISSRPSLQSSGDHRADRGRDGSERLGVAVERVAGRRGSSCRGLLEGDFQVGVEARGEGSGPQVDQAAGHEPQVPR